MSTSIEHIERVDRNTVHVLLRINNVRLQYAEVDITNKPFDIFMLDSGHEVDMPTNKIITEALDQWIKTTSNIQKTSSDQETPPLTK